MPSDFVKHWIEHREKCFGDTPTPTFFRHFVDALRIDKKFCQPEPCTEHVIAVDGPAWAAIKWDVNSERASQLIEEFRQVSGKLANERYSQPISLIQLSKASLFDGESEREYYAALKQHKNCLRSTEMVCSSYFDHMLMGSCMHNFFGDNFQHRLFLTGWVIAQPTIEDKVTALVDKRLYPAWHPLHGGPGNGHVVHHIMSFEDLQHPGDEVSGYTLNYDFLTSQIVIQKTKGAQQKLTWATNYQETEGVLFCGSPAALTNKIVGFESIIPSQGFDIVVKLIASEWMMLMSDSLTDIQAPVEQKGTFTEHLLKGLGVWMLNTYEGEELDRIPFKNIWGPQPEDG